MSIVFLCIDSGGAKRVIIEKLVEFGIPFIDVGLGVNLEDGMLGGIVRVTTCAPSSAGLAKAMSRIPLFDSDGLNEYDRNIQIPDLNALSAVLAVIRWKKMLGYYRDLDHEQNCSYVIDGNQLLNEDKPNA